MWITEKSVKPLGINLLFQHPVNIFFLYSKAKCTMYIQSSLLSSLSSRISLFPEYMYTHNQSISLPSNWLSKESFSFQSDFIQQRQFSLSSSIKVSGYSAILNLPCFEHQLAVKVNLLTPWSSLGDKNPIPFVKSWLHTPLAVTSSLGWIKIIWPVPWAPSHFLHN